jgi:asparagine synthase (glutamine-hydrolysing)
MCGITGYIDFQGTIKDTSIILNMLKVQKHRGPDDSGIRAFNMGTSRSMELSATRPSSVTNNFDGMLGFNRLSILDLSSNGHQPMVSPDNKIILTLNGEIYNAFDYKPELESWGYKFKSTSDTEVVLALYLRYGFEGLLQRLNGMFAIVIVDLNLSEIFITRDRFGIKPMYYITREDYFAFSSELKSFDFLPGFDFQLDYEQLDEFLLFRNNLVGTLFKDIYSLEPGHYLKYSLGKGLTKKKYFQINDYSRSLVSRNLEFYGDELENWLSNSVQMQLMSDVKLGCQLSGGIDSSLVTWLANRGKGKDNFEAVSIIFNDSRFSEEDYIDEVINGLSIPGHKFLLESDYYLDNIEKATWHLEAPINHPNTIGIYKLSQRAKEYVTVLLSGEGADEVFGGYPRFYDIGYPYRFKRLLSELKNNIEQPNNLFSYFDDSLRAILATAFMTPLMAAKLKNGFDSQRAINTRRLLYQTLSGSLFDRQVKYEMHVYLPDLLIRQDKMSMAHSIENRVPFLDNEVVKNSFSIPERYLLLKKSPEGKKNNEKYLLKKMIASTFGNDFAFRDKMGFGIPLREFFTEEKFSQYLNDKIIPGIRNRDLFNYRLVSDWMNGINSLRFSEIEALWVAISFEIWASLYLD